MNYQQLVIRKPLPNKDDPDISSFGRNTKIPKTLEVLHSFTDSDSYHKHVADTFVNNWINAVYESLLDLLSATFGGVRDWVNLNTQLVHKVLHWNQSHKLDFEAIDGGTCYAIICGKLNEDYLDVVSTRGAASDNICQVYHIWKFWRLLVSRWHN